ncbi:hypothetical protein Daus18300_004629 [Diaporthe australafricana]|uniref:Uncharacterized protein n=1 Tax=Diaporthe australafricana TaxID=127596 RepID=A0ABR3X6R9_9PEZI
MQRHRTDTGEKRVLCPVLSWRRNIFSHNIQNDSVHLGSSVDNLDEPCQHNTGSGSGSGTPTTLLSGWYWIRGVESPYFHSYLQALPTASPGTALLDSYLTAGQFNIIDGQLVYNTGSGAAAGALYLNVEDPADKTQRALATTFKATKNTYGSFAFSGDTVTWTDPDVARPNTAAFYVCPGTSAAGANALYINTGAYLYQTPSGCYDVDVSSTAGSEKTVKERKDN